MSRKTPEEQFEVIDRNERGIEIIIRGRKLPPPAKRVVLTQAGLKIVSAKVTQIGKNNSLKEFEIVRINHLPTRSEIRIHTAETLFPGEYELRLTTKR